ncbi:IS3 family transposase [Spiroplasma endosymbiont of Polydrusus pterygomalis]
MFDFVHWYNNIRIHGRLNYLTPIRLLAIPVQCFF